MAAYTKPRFEHKVKRYCEDHKIEAFLPTYPSWRRWSDRKKLLEMPLFPSYLFVRVAPDQRARALQAPGFLWFVGNRQGPAMVAEAELDVIRCLMASGLRFDPLPEMQLGDEAEVVKGALRGCRGRLLRKDGHAIVLRVAAVPGMVRVALPDASWIRRTPVPAAMRALRAMTCM